MAGGRLRRPRLGELVAVAVPAAALGWVLVHWSVIDSGTDALTNAHADWLAAAIMIASLTWVAGAVCQQGSVLEHLPVGRLLAVQLAGSAANHVLPAGIGVAAVNLRFLRGRGLSRRAALNAVGLNTGAGIVVHLLAMGVLLAVGAAALPVTGTGRWAVICLAAAAALVVVSVAVPVLRRLVVRAVRGILVPAWAQWVLVARHPIRSVQLWSGSVAVPVLHALTLLCVERALGVPMSVLVVFGVYFLASGVSALIPSPGGFGSLDAALTVGLQAAGAPLTQTIAAVLAYRLITVWIPLLPSACTLGVLRRRAVI
ncbi:MAG: lysylphosphatidylglycerol synthase transmembrane domain-containing protein [Mycobacteriales bacterium]